VMAGEGPPGAVLHLEGAEAIDPGLESLEFWYGAGLRSLGPVWSRPNAFGTGAPIPGPRDPDDGPGLTEAGVRLVKACSELGILIDLSHMNRTAFWDVARLEAGPLVATHAAAYSLSPSARNLTDDQIDEVGKTNGLIGIVFGALFVRPDCRNDADTDLALIAAHARYVADRIGVEHVALGSDFDGTTVPSGLGDAAGLPRLLDALSDAGFTSDELRMIGFENWRRVLAAWW
jgi:membrane dipeptidase